MAYITAMAKVKQENTNSIPYLTLPGELWGVDYYVLICFALDI